MSLGERCIIQYLSVLLQEEFIIKPLGFSSRVIYYIKSLLIFSSRGMAYRILIELTLTKMAYNILIKSVFKRYVLLNVY